MACFDCGYPECDCVCNDKCECGCGGWAYKLPYRDGCIRHKGCSCGSGAEILNGQICPNYKACPCGCGKNVNPNCSDLPRLKACRRWRVCKCCGKQIYNGETCLSKVPCDCGCGKTQRPGDCPRSDEYRKARQARIEEAERAIEEAKKNMIVEIERAQKKAGDIIKRAETIRQIAEEKLAAALAMDEVHVTI